MNTIPFRLDIKSSDDNLRHAVKVHSGSELVAEFLLSGKRVVSSVAKEPRRMPRFRQAALSLVEMGACGGHFSS